MDEWSLFLTFAAALFFGGHDVQIERKNSKTETVLMWVMVSLFDVRYISVVVCFVAFFLPSPPNIVKNSKRTSVTRDSAPFQTIMSFPFGGILSLWINMKYGRIL